MSIIDRLRGRTDLSPLATRRHDGVGGRWTNAATGMGGPMDRHVWTRFDHPEPLMPTEIDALLRFSAVARRGVERASWDATREGFDLEGPGGELVMKRLQQLGDRGFLNEIGAARTWARAYGGAAIVLCVDDGRDPELPIGVGRLAGVLTLDRHEIRPAVSDAWWRPRIYQVSPRSGAAVRIHASRVLRFEGTRLPWREKQREDGWGGSLFDLAFAELRDWSVTNVHAAEAVTLLTQGVFKRKNLGNAVALDKGEEIANRAEVLRIGLGLFGDMVLDDTESYDVIGRPITGMKEAAEMLDRALVAAFGMPRLILFGETPGGMHAGADNPEIRAWYDDVSKEQASEYEPALSAAIRLIAYDEGVPAPMLTWRSLYQVTEKEQAEIDTARANRRQIDLMSGVISKVEARRDPDLARLYQVTAAEIPALTGEYAVPGLEPADTTSVAESAMNGAQVTALQGIAMSVAAGELPRQSALAMIRAAFPAAAQYAEQIVPLEGDGPADAPGETLAPAPYMPPEGEDLVSSQDAGSRLGVSAATIRRLHKSGVIGGWRVGARWRYALSEIARAVHSEAANVAE